MPDLQIKALRIARNMTALELADAVGVGRTYITNVENGRANPSLDVLCSIADALNADVSDLFVKPGLPVMRKVFADPQLVGVVRGFMDLPQSMRDHACRYMRMLREEHAAGKGKGAP